MTYIYHYCRDIALRIWLIKSSSTTSKFDCSCSAKHRKQPSARNICDAIGSSTVSYDTAKAGFQKFKHGDFDIEDQPLFGLPVAASCSRRGAPSEDGSRESPAFHLWVGCGTRAHLRCPWNTWRYDLGVPHYLKPPNHLPVRRNEWNF